MCSTFFEKAGRQLPPIDSVLIRLTLGSPPNNALQRTRAAALLQSVSGELSTSSRRRAPLSFRTLGDNGSR